MASRIASASSRRSGIAGQQAVVGIDRRAPRAGGARLPVDRRGQDQAVQRLGAPARAHQLGGQELEQLGMSRRRAGVAQVVGRGGQAGAEMVLPDPVGQHPGQQRRRPRAGPGQPPRQGQPPAGRARARQTAASARSGLSGSVRKAGTPGPDLRAGRGRVAPEQERDRGPALARDVGRPRRSGRGGAGAGPSSASMHLARAPSAWPSSPRPGPWAGAERPACRRAISASITLLVRLPGRTARRAGRRSTMRSFGLTQCSTLNAG